MLIYQNTNFYFFWKPHWLASSFGNEKSFLDYIFYQKEKLPNNFISYQDIDKDTLVYIKDQINSLNLEPVLDTQSQSEIIQNLIKNFDKENEYWLLNRLDNDTSWFLYFAKDASIYHEYKIKQADGLFTKYYIAQVKWNPFYKSDKKEMDIDYPIMHHKFASDRMVCIKQDSDLAKWSWKEHMVSSKISLLSFDKSKNISTLLISISKWIRHQIRVHLSSIWCPIIWENIYSNDKSKDFLHLRSVWFIFKHQKNK